MMASLMLLLVALNAGSASAYPQVEVCFVLDTTGSMSPLIATAKEKIWYIANEIVRAPGQPQVRFCLLGYRDRGDAYITRHFDLTDDLDQIHKELLAFQADGGGDGPEAVNQALLEAVENTTWSAEDNRLRVIFLVGDAPPHLDYDEPQYGEIAARAARKGIIINPVLCGRDQATDEIWRSIAAAASGEATQIDPGQSRPTITTPMDQDLAVLGPRLDRLTIPYGPQEVHETSTSTHKRVEKLDHAVAADRLSYKSGSGSLVDKVDLVQALDRGKVDSSTLQQEWLPQTLRSMTTQELMDHLQTVRIEREEIQRIIHALVDQRRAFLDGQRQQEGFESTVSRLISQQMRARQK